jgi:hypothetical protein
VPGKAGAATLANTGNLILRLDRNAATNVLTGDYSTTDGATWVVVGSVTTALTNPRLGVQVGANLAGPQVADLAWAEVHRPAQ